MRRSLAVVTPPATDPVTLDEAKAWGRVDGGEDDALLAALISTATATVEQYLNRALVTQTLTLTLDPAGSGRTPWVPGHFELPVNYFDGGFPDTFDLLRGPVQSISSVLTYDTSNVSATFDPAGYRLQGDRLVLNDTYHWPGNLRAAGASEVTYVAGYGTANDVPQPIKTAILMTVAAMYDSRGSCDDNGLAPGAARLLAPYRLFLARGG